MSTKVKQAVVNIFAFFGFTLSKKTKLDKFIFEFFGRNPRLIFYFVRMYGKISEVEGDIVECGLGKMRTFQVLSFLLENDKNNKRVLWGFDSFEGFPSPTPEDNSYRNPQKGEWAHLTKQDAKDLLVKVGMGSKFLDTRIHFVEGFFEDTLPKYEEKIQKIAFLHLDVDLYASYRDCLNYLFPKVVKGGVVLFDEYKNQEIRWPGAKKAIDEYFEGTSYKIQKDEILNKYFLIKE